MENNDLTRTDAKEIASPGKAPLPLKLKKRKKSLNERLFVIIMLAIKVIHFLLFFV